MQLNCRHHVVRVLQLIGLEPANSKFPLKFESVTTAVNMVYYCMYM